LPRAMASSSVENRSIVRTGPKAYCWTMPIVVVQSAKTVGR
jgi:hypothetical protein